MWERRNRQWVFTENSGSIHFEYNSGMDRVIFFDPLIVDIFHSEWLQDGFHEWSTVFARYADGRIVEIGEESWWDIPDSTWSKSIKLKIVSGFVALEKERR